MLFRLAVSTYCMKDFCSWVETLATVSQKPRTNASDSALHAMMNLIDPTNSDIPDLVQRFLKLYKLIFPIDTNIERLQSAWQSFRDAVQNHLDEGIADRFRNWIGRQEKMVDPRTAQQAAHLYKPTQIHFSNALTYLREIRRIIPMLDMTLTPYPEAHSHFRKFMELFDAHSEQMEMNINKLADQAGFDPDIRATAAYSPNFQGRYAGETPSQFGNRVSTSPTVIKK